ncbi:2-dehydropantoate 2-reductase [Stenotrophomonas mori]|uniref:2-dehydropantoate 2-reductase n=1 Tax=Stenotrophomonas mori TaxID=2871096 RepID=A0ABT0SHR5_9GAMM|nr:2-dehydropantoate 2-reductase [Stenotrophomonas mori]MCL7714651.1 2-dehydropantoate 2-reductase [Stenotrophomonas mori]
MRILILGAGGTGGYFGGRLAQAGIDVTFLVRPARAAQLERDGLVIRSPLGDAAFPVAHVGADALPALAAARPFDLVVLSCKAYDLDGSIAAIAPAVTAGTTLLPILNGLRHYAALDARFGRDAVLGGLCFISATKADDGAIVHLDTPARLTFGERDGGTGSARVAALAAACTAAGIDHVASPGIAREQWIKYTYLTALAAGTCLMRADVGRIAATTHGRAFMQALYHEGLAVAAAAGQAIPDKARDIALASLTQAGSPIKASMLRDLEAGQRVEAAHIIGDMLERAQAAGQQAPLLQAASCHLQAYEAQRPA